MSDDYWWDQRYAAMFYAVHGCNPGETLRIMVTGSRWFADPPALYGAMDAAATGLTPVVVHGKCNPRHPDTREPVPWRMALMSPPWRKASLLGADWHAHLHAQARGWAEEPHPADWRRADPAALYTKIVSVRGIDINGQLFGDLVVQEKTDQADPKGSPLWRLTCAVCGEDNLRSAPDLRRGRDACLAACRNAQAQNSPVRSIYGQYKRNASRAGREFALEFDWFKNAIRQDCHYCGSSPTAVFKKPGARVSLAYNGLDRVDSSAGYVISNVVTCCKFCNWAKGKWGVADFQDWLVRVRTGYGRKAGFMRNADMVARGAHKCIAALQPGEECKGTRMCADLAAKAFIPVVWVPAPPDDFAGHNA